MSPLPPLPPGFTLDTDPQTQGGGLPPLPPGFTLDAPASATTAASSSLGTRVIRALPEIAYNWTVGPLIEAGKVLSPTAQRPSPQVGRALTEQEVIERESGRSYISPFLQTTEELEPAQSALLPLGLLGLGGHRGGMRGAPKTPPLTSLFRKRPVGAPTEPPAVPLSPQKPMAETIPQPEIRPLVEPTAKQPSIPSVAITESPAISRMHGLRNTIEDARSTVPTGKQFYRDQEGNIVKTGNAGALLPRFQELFPEIADLPPGTTPKELITAIDKDRGNKLYLQIKDAVEQQMAKEAASPEAIVQRPTDYEDFARLVDEMAAGEQGAPPGTKQPWGMRVQRIEERGVTGGGVEKPHGLYTSPANIESPHTDLGGTRRTFDTNPKANVLILPDAPLSDPSTIMRKGAMSGSSGVMVAKELLGTNEFNRLRVLNKHQLIEKARAIDPAIDWNRYYDTQEIMEGIGGVLARRKGYDAIFAPDKLNPEFTEYIGLTDNAFISHAGPAKSSTTPRTATQPKLFQTQAEVPLTPLQTTKPQVEHGQLLEGFKPPEPPAPELPSTPSGTVELPAGLPIPKDIKEWFGRNFVPRYRYAEDMKAALRSRAGQLDLAHMEAVEAGKSVVSGLSTKTERSLSGAALQGKVAADPKVAVAVRKTRQDIDNLSRQIRDEGILAPDVVNPNLGSYTRRLYLRDILKDKWATQVRKDYPQVIQEAKAYLQTARRDAGQLPLSEAQLEDTIQRILTPKMGQDVVLPGGKIRIGLSPTKARKDIPLEIRQLMGEVDDGGYLAARTMADMSSLLINKRFFDRIIKGMDDPKTPLFRDTPADGYSQFPLPDVPNLGAVKNKYILQKYEPEIRGLFETPSEAARIYDRAYGLWKMGKVLNPKTYLNNIIANVPFADFAGSGVFDPRNRTYYKQGIQALRDKGPLYKEMLLTRALGTEYYGGEIKAMASDLLRGGQSPFDAMANAAERFAGPALKQYNAVDQVFKAASFLKQKQLGMTSEQAAAHVNKWFQNYEEVGPAVKFLRRSPIGAPFVRFQAEMVRIYGNAMKEHPFKLAKWLIGIPAGITAYSAAKNGVSMEDLVKMHKRLPRQLQRKYLALAPMRGPKNELQVWDLSNTLPGANLLEDATGIPGMSTFMLSHPLTNTLLQIGFDVNFRTHRPITEPGVSRAESATKFALEQALPSLTPGIGYGAKRITGAFAGRPQKWPYTRVETPGKALVGTLTPFGTIPLDESVRQQRAAQDQRSLIDLSTQMSRVRRNRSLSSSERNTRLQRLQEQRRELFTR